MDSSVPIELSNGFISDVIRRKDWDKLIELSGDPRTNDNVISFFSNPKLVKDLAVQLSDAQILKLVDTATHAITSSFFEAVSEIADENPRFTKIALDLLTHPYLHTQMPQCIINCLPEKETELILQARIPNTELYFNNINEKVSKSLSGKYHFKSLEERYANNFEQLHITPKRKSTVLVVIKVLKEVFDYIETLNDKSPLIEASLRPIAACLFRCEKLWSTTEPQTKEVKDKLREVLMNFNYNKVFPLRADKSVYDLSKNRIFNVHQLNYSFFTECGVLDETYFYSVFKRAVEDNNDEKFRESVSSRFFSNNRALCYLRSMNDGVFEKLFDMSVDQTVRELIDHKQSNNLTAVIRSLNFNQSRRPSNNSDNNGPTYEEAIKFVKSVITKVFEKKSTLNSDVTAYPQICLNILKLLLDIRVDSDFLEVKYRTPFELLEPNMKNQLIIGAIRHPTDETKFTQFISTHHPTYLVALLSHLQSVSNICLVLPEKKRNTLDKYSFMKGKMPGSKEFTMMSIVEVFLLSMRFWDNNDLSYFGSGYKVYYLFMNKIMREALNSEDIELKKAAISVYKRMCHLLTCLKHTKFAKERLELVVDYIQSFQAFVVGSQVEENFIENIMKTYIKPIPARYYAEFAVSLLRHSHVDNAKYDLDTPCSQAIHILLQYLLEHPISNISLGYRILELPDFNDEENGSWIDVLKQHMSINSRPVIDICNPLKEENTLGMQYNSPTIYPIEYKDIEVLPSAQCWLECVKYVVNYSKTYKYQDYNNRLTKMMIGIQELVKDCSSRLFERTFYLERPNEDTNIYVYRNQERSYNILYHPGYFNLLEELNKWNHILYNEDNYKIVEELYTYVFMNEQQAAKKKKKPEFYGILSNINVKKHRDFDNINSLVEYQNVVENYKSNVRNDTYAANNSLYSNNITYQLTQKLFEALDTNFQTQKLKLYFDPIYGHPQYTFTDTFYSKFFSALEKCNAELIYSSRLSISTIINYKGMNETPVKANVITKLIDLLLQDFSNKKLKKKFGEDELTYQEVYEWLSDLSILASSSIGHLSNLPLACKLTEKNINDRIQDPRVSLFVSLWQAKDIEQLLLCMSSPLFTNATTIIKDCIISHPIISKIIIPQLIQAINGGKTIRDEFLVSLASLALRPEIVGYPAPKWSFEFLHLISKGSLNVKRSVVANIVYYIQLLSSINENLPDIFPILEQSYKGMPDEMCAFFCLLVNKDVALSTMRSNPALSDLCVYNVLPESFIAPGLYSNSNIDIKKELGELYEKIVDTFVLAGLVSKKAHIVDLTISILTETNLSSNLPTRIAPFIQKGLKTLSPGEDNKAFIKFATLFTAKNPQFTECFTSYEDALQILKNYSCTICKENARKTKNSSTVPEAYTKFQQIYENIISTIEKPFADFKDQEEMQKISQFCRHISSDIIKYRPAVSLGSYIKLESYLSIFGDEHMEKCALSNDKSESLSELINVFCNRRELAKYVPHAIVTIFNQLKLSFTEKHTLQLTHLPDEMQNARDLANIVTPVVLEHLPECNDDELVDVLSKLGIFGQPPEIHVLRTESALGAAPYAAPMAYPCSAAVEPQMDMLSNQSVRQAKKLHRFAAAPGPMMRMAGAAPAPQPPMVGASFRAKAAPQLARSSIQANTLECCDACEDSVIECESCGASAAVMNDMACDECAIMECKALSKHEGGDNPSSESSDDEGAEVEDEDNGGEPSDEEVDGDSKEEEDQEENDEDIMSIWN